MGPILKDAFHDEFGTWPIAYTPYGGLRRRSATATIRRSTMPGRQRETGSPPKPRPPWTRAFGSAPATFSSGPAPQAKEVCPLLILTTVTDRYFASAVAASRRGYHCLLFDGPGQGEMLHEHGVRLRPDWETVACVADPGPAEPRRRLPRLHDRVRRPAGSGDRPGRDRPGEPGWHVGGGHGDRKLRWTIVQRGFWVHGVDITLAEADPLTAGTQAFFEALRCPKDLIRFAVADGAGDHCEMLNRSRLNRSVLDWLDGVLGCGPR